MFEHAGDDAVDPSVEDSRHVFHRLADAEVYVLLGQIYAVPAKLSDTDLEANTGPEGRLLEEERDGLALQGSRVRALQALRLSDDVRDLGGGEIGYREKVLLHGLLPERRFAIRKSIAGRRDEATSLNVGSLYQFGR